MQPKNVLIICSDEHARTAMGCAGHSVASTPTLDTLAARGTRFTQAYTPSPTCVPARACLATGTHVHENRCWSSAEPYHGQHESWMHRLRERDHAVVAIGKLHFRSADDDNGFNEEIVPMHVAGDGLDWPQSLVRDPLPAFDQAAEMAHDIGPGDSPYTEYDRRITAETCDWLNRYPRKIKNKPWALFVSFVSPHYPLTAPTKFFDLYAGRDMPPTVGALPDHPVVREMAEFWDYDSHFDEQTRETAKRAYFGLGSFLDDNVRQVLEALEDSGAARDTVVIYLSDHGEMLGNHGFWGKSVMYEESAGVPLIISGGDVPVGINSTLVSLTDMAATIEDIAGSDSPPRSEPWHGRSALNFIDAPDSDRFILSEYHDGGSPTGFFMVRHETWKYVHYAGDHPDQLFDLEADPGELADRGDDTAFDGHRERLHRLLTSIVDPDAVNAEAFADQARRLDELGGAEAVLARPGFNHTPTPTG